MTKRVRCASLLFVFACAPTRALEVPQVEGAHTLVAFSEIAGVTHAFVSSPADASGAQFPIHADRNPLTLLFLEAELAELELESGQMLTTDPEGRALPEALAAYELSDVDNGLWRELETLRPEVRDFRFAYTSAAECAASGRCFVPGSVLCMACPEPPIPAAPASARLPVLEPCPAGWASRLTRNGGPVVCEPLQGGLPDCPPAEMALPSRPTCAPIGRACPAGDWPDPLPVGIERRYVGQGPPGAPPARVYTSLASAIAAARAGDRILLAKGDHDVTSLGAVDVSIEGTCVGGTRLHIDATVSSSAAIELTELSLDGERLIATDSGRLALANIATATIRLEAALGGVLTLSDVRTTTGAVSGRGTIELRRAFIDGYGPFVIGASASLTAEDVVLKGVPSAVGFLADEGAHITLRRVLVDDAGTAVDIQGGSRAELEDVVLRRGLRGAVVEDLGSHATLSRVSVFGARGNAIGIFLGSIEGSDIAMIGPPLPAPGAVGLASGVLSMPVCTPSETDVKLNGVYIEGMALFGYVAYCSAIHLEDVIITENQSAGLYFNGCETTGARWRFFDNPDRGIVVAPHLPEGASEVLEGHLEVSDVSMDGHRNEAIAVGGLSDARLERVEIVNGSRHGISVRDSGEVVASDVRVERVTSEGPDGSCVLIAGSPVFPLPARLELSRFVVAESVFGFDLREKSEVRLERGRIRGNTTAFSLRNDAADVYQLLYGVVLEGNDLIGL